MIFRSLFILNERSFFEIRNNRLNTVERNLYILIKI